jgi:hypothetical protein
MNNQFARICAVLMLSLLAMPGSAQIVPSLPLDQNNPNSNPRLQEVPRATQPALAISEARAVELARQLREGNVLRIGLVGEGANRRYQIRMENEGKIFTLFVHASTGVVSEN